MNIICKFRRHPKALFYTIFAAAFVLLCLTTYYFHLAGARLMEEQYEQAINLFNSGKYNEANDLFSELGNYKESKSYINSGEYKSKLSDIRDRLDANEELNDQQRQQGYVELITMLGELENGTIEDDQIKNEISDLKVDITYRLAVSLYNSKDYNLAMKEFQNVPGYENSAYYIAQLTLLLYPDAQKVLYDKANSLLYIGDYLEARGIYEELGDYKNSALLADKCDRMLLSNPVSAGIRATVFINAEQKIEYRGDLDSNLKELEDFGKPVSVSAIGTILLILDENGRVRVYGSSQDTANTLEIHDNVVQIATGQAYAAILTSDGKVYAIGHNGDHQGDMETEWADNTVKEISCGWRTTVGLDSDGNILACGYRAGYYMREIEEHSEKWQNIIHISTGGGGKDVDGKGHIVGLRMDKTVVAIGDNTFGQCNTGEWSDVIAISAGDYHTVGLRSDGTVYITNKKGYEIKEFPERIIKISAGTGYTIFVDEKGQAYTDDDAYTHQGQVQGIEEWHVYVK